jgi:DNA gyrase subunit B
LADCSERDPALSELYLVEGNSAGGSAKEGRNRRFQAILPLRGKVINVEKNRLDKVLANEEVRTIVTAVGAGIGDDEFDADKVRYHKIVIMTDADVDGAHIRTLLLTFLFRQMRQLIERGYVYIAQPPLYLVRKGKKVRYIEKEDDLDRYLVELGSDGVTLVKTEDGKEHEFTPTQFKNVLEGISGLERISRLLSRRQISLDHLLQHQDPETHAFPQFQVIQKNEVHFCYGEKDMTRICESLEEAEPNGEEEEMEEGSEPEPVERKDPYRVVEIHESKELRSVINRLRAIGIDFPAFNGADAESERSFDEDEERKAPYYLRLSGDETYPVHTVRGILKQIKAFGRRGVEVQRYKGLGEMNPTQLWETTMDPANRTLLQVTLEDAVAADSIFNILMGDAVDQRREFIQEHAPQVRFLDV